LAGRLSDLDAPTGTTVVWAVAAEEVTKTTENPSRTIKRITLTVGVVPHISA
jgi:hypothetical protein